MKVIMQEDGQVSYNGIDPTQYKKGQDISNIDQWAKDHFIKKGKAKEIAEKKTQYKKGQDISNIDQWAKEIAEKKTQEKVQIKKEKTVKDVDKVIKETVSSKK